MKAIAVAACLATLLLLWPADVRPAHTYGHDSTWGFGIVELGGHDVAEWRAYGLGRNARLRQLQRRLDRLERQLELTWPGRERDHSRAIAVAGATFPAPTPDATRGWLDGCARSEGGRGPWKWNGGFVLSALGRLRMASLERRGENTLEHKPSGSSGAGGWWQFMRGTFYGNVRRAFAAARARGVAIPRRYANWYSRVGQAFTAASMLRRGHRSAWEGANC